jgi:chorismate mutase/prephenate dehydratase
MSTFSLISLNPDSTTIATPIAIQIMLSAPSDLEELRRRLDGIDDKLQDLLIERMEVVAGVAAQKRGGSVSTHVPAREAEILRRLVERQGDAFPAGTLIRMWRELLAATTRRQGPFAIAAFAAPEAFGVWDLARDHYGSHTPMTAYHSTFQVIRAVTERRVAVGVLPMPQDGDDDPWWRHLLSPDIEAPRIIARLPFGPRGNARSDSGDALAIGYGTQQPTGTDRTVLATENAVAISRGRFVAALSKLGLSCTFVTSCEQADAVNTLIEIDGYLAMADPRLDALRAQLGGDLFRLLPVGGYAVPLKTAERSTVAASAAGDAVRAAGAARAPAKA